MFTASVLEPSPLAAYMCTDHSGDHGATDSAVNIRYAIFLKVAYVLLVTNESRSVSMTSLVIN